MVLRRLTRPTLFLRNEFPPWGGGDGEERETERERQRESKRERERERERETDQVRRKQTMVFMTILID